MRKAFSAPAAMLCAAVASPALPASTTSLGSTAVRHSRASSSWLSACACAEPPSSHSVSVGGRGSSGLDRGASLSIRAARRRTSTSAASDSGARTGSTSVPGGSTPCTPTALHASGLSTCTAMRATVLACSRSAPARSGR